MADLQSTQNSKNARKINSYNISLYIKNFDISRFLNRFQIVGDLSYRYSHIILGLRLDFKDFALDNQLYGVDELTFKIEHLNVEDQVIDTYEYVLSIMQSTLSLAVHNINAYEDPTPMMVDSIRQDVTIVTVPTASLSSLGISINYVSKDDDPKTAFDFIKEIVEKAGVNTNYFLSENSNPQLIRQLVVPPLSINKMITFMNNHYGIYKGPLFCYCDHIGQVMMWDLKSRYNHSPDFIIHHYAIDNKAQDTIDEEIQALILQPGTPSHFMSVSPIDILKVPNSDIIQNGYVHASVFHPPNDLYGSVNINTQQLIEQAGLFDKNNTYPNNRNLQIFKKNYFSTCNEVVDDTMFKSNIAINYCASAPVRVKIRGYCRFSYFLQVGVPCELRMYTTVYKEYGGKYILGKSIIDVTRGDQVNWKTDIKAILYRSI